jgi:cobalt-precorrin-5B (C1)-methyltransferase
VARSLRRGYSTGACAAAAAKGAALLLFGRSPNEVGLRLPWADPHAPPVSFPLVHAELPASPGGPCPSAACGVVKDAGDDPDVTHGLEIRAEVRSQGLAEGGVPTAIRIEGGEGVGRTTKPGLAVPVGRPAITPVPLAMIEHAVREALAETNAAPAGLQVTISVPGGEEAARRTLNGRLGIVGGLSILGTTGIVLPMSAGAWTATIDASLDVARATGCSRALLAHGRSSEAAARKVLPALAPEAFVLMGDHVGHALQAAAGRGLDLALAGQFAKFCKVAAGFFETHAKDSTLDLGVLSTLLAERGFGAEESRGALAANTAREVFERLREGGDRGLFAALAERVAERASRRIGARVAVEALLFGYRGELLARRAVPSGACP